MMHVVEAFRGMSSHPQDCLVYPTKQHCLTVAAIATKQCLVTVAATSGYIVPHCYVT